MLADRYFQERYEAGRRKGIEEGREKGREEVERAWLAWYERMRAAQAEGKPFDEPPPVGKGKGGG